MVHTRLGYLEQELVGTRIALGEMKTANAKQREEIVHLHEMVTKLERTLVNSERKRISAEEDAHHMALALKVCGGTDGSHATSASCATQCTDDITLSEWLPEVPSHLSPASNSAPLSLISPAPTESTSINTNHRSAVVNRAQAAKGVKRSHRDMETEPHDYHTSQANASSGKRIVVCIGCYTNKRRCDPVEPCRACVDNGTLCKRARCGDYRADTCNRQSCLRAHEKDEVMYKNLVWAGHVSRKKAKSESKRDKRQDDGDEDGDDQKPRMGQKLLA